MNATVVFALIDKPAAKAVIKFLAKDKTATLREIMDRSQIDSMEAMFALDFLMDAGLVGEQKSPVKDFNTYYVTADGLAAEQALSRMNL